jgi:amino acid transporter
MEPHLRRTIGIWQMTFYGMGSMLGAGIYGLIGVAAGEMGSAVWLAFLISLIAALLTGLSYASLGSRYPRAAGSAFVIQRAYNHNLLTHVAGLAVAASGITSMAAGARVIGVNLQRLSLFDTVPVTVLAICFLTLLAAIVYRGIRESMWVNVVCTIVEAGGLLLVVAVGFSYWGSADLLETPSGEGLGSIPFALLMQGAALTFYSFIGFEDTINVAEEVKDAERTLPWGVVLSMIGTFAIYLCVAITAVSVVPWRELAASGTPLVEVMARAAPWFPAWLFIVITIFSVANTGLINYVTASRLLYGMARDRQLPRHLSIVHAQRRTPHVAVALILAILIVLALVGDIAQLASATVLLLLAVFSVVNIALVILKLRPGEPKGAFEIPIFVPVLGSVVCLALLIARSLTGDWRAPVIAALFIVAALVLYLGIRKRT